jgi:hypothetical protein
MNLSDINETVLLKLDPEVAKAVIEAQSDNNMWVTFGGIGVSLAMVALFWVIFKYT